MKLGGLTMNKTHHLALNRYIFYVLMFTVGIFSVGLLLGLIFVGVMSDLFVILLLLTSFLISAIFFYFHVIIVNEDTLIISQKMGFTRVIVDIKDIREMIVKDYKPRHDVRFIREGYKISLHKKKEYIKIILGQYSVQTRQSIILYILKKNPSIKLNKRMQKEVEGFLS